MHIKDRFPVQSNPPARPVKRHLSASNLAHRVKESLTTRVSKILCAIFLSLLFCLGIVTFILWISLRPHRPRFHIHGFSVSGMGQPDGFDNARITFNVAARNPNQNVGVYYDSMEGSVYYRGKRVGSTRLLDPFFQGPKNTTYVNGELTGPTLTVNKDRWMEITRDRNQGTMAFRLEILSIIRFKVSAWHSKSHRMYANCDVEVGRDGMLLARNKDRRCPVYFT